jgi:hypothetical protein
MYHPKKSYDKYIFSCLLLKNEGEVVEVRILGSKGENRAWEGCSYGIVYGFFDNPQDLYKSVRLMERCKASYKGIYITLNPVKLELISNSKTI